MTGPVPDGPWPSPMDDPHGDVPDATPAYVNDRPSMLLAPTRKWIAAAITGAGTLATLAITSGLHQELAVAAVGYVIARATSWLTPNADPQEG